VVRIRIELTGGNEEEEIVIRCAQADERIRRIQQILREPAGDTPQIGFYKNNSEYYFPLDDVLFFETESDAVYAHTAGDSFKTRLRLYELENALPRRFVRVSKSTILNTDRVRTLTHNIASASLAEFADTHKHVYVSRRYFGELKQRLNERTYTR
jgi:DNA-binding LytR/AlgR family response regulator